MERRLQEVFRVFEEGAAGRFTKDDLKNVYLFGSRLYGCAMPDSDYDLICVVTGDYFHGSILIENEQRHKEGHHEFELNLNLYHVNFFHSLIQKNMINALMCINLPREHVWLERHQLPACKDVLRLPALKKAVIMDASHNLAKAKRLWSEGDIRVSKKNLVHGLRYLHFALQLAETGKISDFMAGNEYWKDIMENTADDWSVYENKYRPLYMDMMHTLKYWQDTKGGLEEEEKTGLQLMHYLKEEGMDTLTRNLSIAVHRHKNYSSLFQLIADPISSPLESKVVQECAYGVIIEEKGKDDDEDKKEKEDGKDKDWGMVALSYPKIDYAIDPFTLNVNVKNPKKFNDEWKKDPHKIEVFEKVDGSMAVLYWYGDGWNVCSFKSPDGSEKLTRNKSLPKTTLDAWVISTTLNNEKEEREKEKRRIQLEEEKNKERETKGYSEDTTFAELFWSIWKQSGYHLPDDFGLCYVFELLSDRQVNIVRYAKRSKVYEDKKENEEGELVLHGVVDLSECKEVADFEGIAKRHRWKAVKRFEGFTSLDELLAAADKMNPFVSEGFVLRLRGEDSVLRLKVRSSQWASIALLSWFNDPKTNERQMLDYVRKSYIHSHIRESKGSVAGEGKEVEVKALKREEDIGEKEGHYDCGELLEYFPEWEELLWDMKDRFERFVIFVSEQYDRITSEANGDKRIFAKAAKEKAMSPFASVFFEFRDKQIQRMRAYFSYCQLKKLVVLMGKYEGTKE